jgi:hypothetical protein
MLDWLNDSPGFPETENADSQNREAANPHGYTVSPVSRFSRFQNEGAAQQQDEDGNGTEKNIQHISSLLPDVLEAIAANLEPASPEEPPSPTHEEIAELDALMVYLCELEPWLARYLPEMQAARRRMAPANLAESLACFRRYIREAEARRGAMLGAGDGIPSALEDCGEPQVSTQEMEFPRLADVEALTP